MVYLRVTGKTLSVVSEFLMEKWGFRQEFTINELVVKNYFIALESCYLTVPYHNACHAVDVLSSLLFFINQSETLGNISVLELFACILAALGHDAGHPGVTNRYVVNTNDVLAVEYNDISVLETCTQQLYSES